MTEPLTINLHALGVETANGSSGAVDLGETAEDSGVYRSAVHLDLVVTSTSGPLVVTLETSPDGTAWRNVSGFEAVNGYGKHARPWIELDRFIRAKWTIGASATFALTGTTIAAPLATRKQLENRLSATLVRRTYDDDNDGEADVEPLTQLLLDASSKLRGALPDYDPDDLSPENAILTDELRRLTLNCAEAFAAQRHPEVVQRDWIPLMEQVDRDFSQIRKGRTALGSNANPTPLGRVIVRSKRSNWRD